MDFLEIFKFVLQFLLQCLFHCVDCRDYDNSTNLHIGVTDTKGKILTDAWSFWIWLPYVPIENLNISIVSTIALHPFLSFGNLILKCYFMQYLWDWRNSHFCAEKENVPYKVITLIKFFPLLTIFIVLQFEMKLSKCY